MWLYNQLSRKNKKDFRLHFQEGVIQKLCNLSIREGRGGRPKIILDYMYGGGLKHPKNRVGKSSHPYHPGWCKIFGAGVNFFKGRENFSLVGVKIFFRWCESSHDLFFYLCDHF